MRERVRMVDLKELGRINATPEQRVTAIERMWAERIAARVFANPDAIATEADYYLAKSLMNDIRAPLTAALSGVVYT